MQKPFRGWKTSFLMRWRNLAGVSFSFRECITFIYFNLSLCFPMDVQECTRIPRMLGKVWWSHSLKIHRIVMYRSTVEMTKTLEIMKTPHVLHLLSKKYFCPIKSSGWMWIVQLYEARCFICWFLVFWRMGRAGNRNSGIPVSAEIGRGEEIGTLSRSGPCARGHYAGTAQLCPGCFTVSGFWVAKCVIHKIM